MPQVSVSEFADRLSQIIPTIMKEFTRMQMRELYKDKVTLPQLLILNFLSVQGESRMTDMAHFMKVSTAAMTGLVDRLVKSGYCLRVYDSNDRRIIRIKLTSKGAGLVRRVNEERRKMIVKIFGKISEKDRQDYLRILMQIQDILSQEKEVI